ncbi:ABC transporter substrate-binding protein [Mycobacterium sp. 236(2023)]|uniref:ABC transporter substrate-binding protein n=1 Tax=Mycobacterium sp. 236(2023) TaxID=3038163 RepID=UPI0024157BCC|nr:ABC transporter substrate-binding protein [Mycobacterium sp. 236(2023)]MDG4664858.1 ABC transporter substrate-binding protein [Mycobacterium sp. 236(2023)]
MSVIAAVGATALVLSGCGGSGSESAGGPAGIEISVTHPDDLYGLPWKVGQAQGFFEESGVTIAKIVPAEGGGTTLQNVVAGRLPFGEVATGAVVKGFQEGAPVQAIGGGVQSVSDVLWVALDSSPLTSVEQTANTRWGFTNPGSVTEAMSFLVPEAAGIGGVERKSTGGSGAGIALLEANEVDVAYASPRTVAEQKGALKVVVDSADFVPVYQQTVIVSGRDYAQKNPEQARALLDGYAKSVTWITENPAEAAKLWADSTDIDPQVATDLVTNAVEAGHWSVSFNPEALNSAAKGLALTDGIESVDWNSLATTEYLPDNDKGQLP